MQKNKKNLNRKEIKNPKPLKQTRLASVANIEEFINQKLYEKAVINAELQLAESFKKISYKIKS